jgi:hypothetical protein
VQAGESLERIDHSALAVNQIVIILLGALAFVLDRPWLAAFVAAVMLIGTLVGGPGFGFLYRFLLRPAGWVRPNVLLDHPEPHRFAQGLGGVVLLAGALAGLAGLSALGWGLVWLVMALAALNAFGGFCVGCFLYYWLTRLGVAGFSKAPPAGTFPGMRPGNPGP